MIDISAIKRHSDRFTDEQLLWLLASREQKPPVNWRYLEAELKTSTPVLKQVIAEIEADYARSERVDAN